MNSAFVLKLAGTTYTGWEEMSLRRSIERMAGEFALKLSLKPDEPYLQGGILDGSSCEVLVNDQVILRGYIDSISHSFDDRAAWVNISGRDAVGDLIDCAATVDGPFEFTNQKLDKILGSILAPYKIPVKYLADTGAPFARIAIQPGESAFELIERLCRYRALLPISDGLGGLLIISPGIAVRSSGQLVYGEGGNILSGSLDINSSDRFSLYVVKGQQEGQDETSAEAVASPEGRAADPLVKRYRPKVLTGEGQGYEMTLNQRAQWEASFARARGIRANYRVQGWFIADSEEMWQINTIVKVTDAIRGLARDFLIAGVTFSRSSNGTITDFELSLPEAFDLPAEKEPSSDDIVGDL